MILPVLLYLAIAISFCVFIAWLSRSRGPALLTGVFAALILIATTVAAKIIVIGPVVLSATVVTYSMTFLISDMLSEFYGKRAARHAILSALVADIIFVVTIFFVLRWTPAPVWEGQEAMETVLGQTPRIVLASIAAYIAAQLSDISVYHALKKKTGGRLLWLRNNVSTIIGQSIDSVIFYTVAFLGVVPIVQLIAWTIAAKVFIAIVDTPALYLTRFIYRRKRKTEGGQASEV